MVVLFFVVSGRVTPFLLIVYFVVLLSVFFARLRRPVRRWHCLSVGGLLYSIVYLLAHFSCVTLVDSSRLSFHPCDVVFSYWRWVIIPCACGSPRMIVAFLVGGLVLQRSHLPFGYMFLSQLFSGHLLWMRALCSLALSDFLGLGLLVLLPPSPLPPLLPSPRVPASPLRGSLACSLLRSPEVPCLPLPFSALSAGVSRESTSGCPDPVLVAAQTDPGDIRSFAPSLSAARPSAGGRPLEAFSLCCLYVALYLCYWPPSAPPYTQDLGVGIGPGRARPLRPCPGRPVGPEAQARPDNVAGPGLATKNQARPGRREGSEEGEEEGASSEKGEDSEGRDEKREERRKRRRRGRPKRCGVRRTVGSGLKSQRLNLISSPPSTVVLGLAVWVAEEAGSSPSVEREEGVKEHPSFSTGLSSLQTLLPRLTRSSPCNPACLPFPPVSSGLSHIPCVDSFSTSLRSDSVSSNPPSSPAQLLGPATGPVVRHFLPDRLPPVAPLLDAELGISLPNALAVERLRRELHRIGASAASILPPGTARATRYLSSWVRQHGPSVLIVVKTKMSVISHACVRTLLRHPSFGFLPANGTAGGILLARSSSLSGAVVHVGRYSISASLNGLWPNGPVLITAIYGPCVGALREQLWDELHQVRQLAASPWLLAGDFNCLLSPADSSSPVTSGPSMSAFRSFVDEFGLFDVPPTNGTFTWSNNRNPPILRRLDCFLLSLELFSAFPSSSLVLGPRHLSDYAPLLLSLFWGRASIGHARFRFVLWWLRDESFVATVPIWCARTVNGRWAAFRLSRKLHSIRKEVLTWKRIFRSSKFSEVTVWDEEINLLVSFVFSVLSRTGRLGSPSTDNSVLGWVG
ncbi:hypothetical protein EJ110_NYTH32101 [Nymphaea thermarum]|nr:hypothetical protein EJ110_NYTH32101 [Nymphaea thermarum]